MYFNKIDIDKISIEDLDSKFINIRYNDNPLIIDTPDMYIPFGLEKEYSNYVIKLQFRKTLSDTISFHNFISNLENRLKTLLDSDNLKSQLKYSKFDPLLITKIAQNNNKLFIDATFNGENINIYNIDKKIIANCKIMIDTIFKKNDNYFYKIKLKELKIKQSCV